MPRTLAAATNGSVAQRPVVHSAGNPEPCYTDFTADGSAQVQNPQLLAVAMTFAIAKEATSMADMLKAKSLEILADADVRLAIPAMERDQIREWRERCRQLTA